MLDHPSSATLVDASTLALNLGLTVGQVYRLSAAGRIPKYKAGHRTVRFDIDEVLASLRQEAPDAPPAPVAPVAPVAAPDPIAARAELIARRREGAR